MTLEDTTGRTTRIATLASCSINLANTIVGAGMLGLPGAFGGTGWLGGTILLFVGVVFSSHGLILLAKAAQTVNVYPSSFYTVAHAAVPQYTILIDLAVALKCFGVATGYLITIGDCMVRAMDHIILLLPPIIVATDDAPNNDDAARNTILPSRLVSLLLSRHLWVVAAALGVLPVSFYPSFDSLKHASSLALVFVGMLSAGIVAYAHNLADPCEGYLYHDDVNQECRGEVVAVTNLPSMLQKLPIFIFAFTCQQNIFPIVNELQNPSLLRVRTAILRAIGFSLMVYLVVAIEGYLTYGSNVKGDILLNYPETIQVTVMRICIAFMLTLHYPLQLDPSRRCILSLIAELKRIAQKRNRTQYPRNPKQAKGGGGTSNDELLSNMNANQKNYAATTIDDVNVGLLVPHDCHVALPPPQATRSGGDSRDGVMFYSVTCGFLFLSFIVAMIVDDLGIILALVGATGSTLVSYILPGFIYINIHPKFDLAVGMAYVQLIVGCFIVPVALYFVLQGSAVPS